MRGSGVNGNSVLGNYIGTDISGQMFDPDGPISGGDELSNHDGGIAIYDGAANNTIGGSVGAVPNGPCQGSCNLVSGNRLFEIVLEGAGSGNKIEGNFIGTSVSGGGRLGQFTGIVVRNTSATIVGGTSASQRNVIADGITMFGATAGNNTVQGNFIGVAATGETGIGASQGVSISGGAHDNAIGGITGVTPGGPCTGACNVIAGTSSDGISIFGQETRANVVQGNFIGLTIAGFGAGNGGTGVSVTGCDNLIGGTHEAARNYIGENAIGVDISNLALESCPGGVGNRVQGNYIGVGPDGFSARGNDGIGVRVASIGNTIGGTDGTTPGGACTGACNLISSNGAEGVFLAAAGGLFFTDPIAAFVQGNYIGTSANGQRGPADLGNGADGIFSETNNALIGGVTPNARNVIADNDGSGVQIYFSRFNRVFGNFIGTDTAGMTDVGNTLAGVRMLRANDNQVGGPNQGEGNLISGNDAAGIDVDGSSNLIKGNIIGLNKLRFRSRRELFGRRGDSWHASRHGLPL